MQVAVLVPCHNEETTIARVVSDFRAALPAAVIYVYDNASTDCTSRAIVSMRKTGSPKRSRECPPASSHWLCLNVVAMRKPAPRLAQSMSSERR